MICQSCLGQAMSFVRFVFVIDPRTLHCTHCGAQLQLSSGWYRIWWTSLIFSAVLVIASVILRRIIGWSLLTNLVGLVLLAVAFAWYFWRSAIYEVKSQQRQVAPDIELP
jgi:hypothetical protein